MEYFYKQNSMSYNPTLHNINHIHLKNDVDTQSMLHTRNMNWIYYTKSLNISIRNSPPQYTIIQINAITSTLPASIYQCYETPMNSRTKPDFQSLHLHTFQTNKCKRSRKMSLSRDSLDKDPDYLEIQGTFS